MKDVEPLTEALGIKATFEQMIRVMGFHDISSFVLVSIFVVFALTFAICCGIFLVKKRKERLAILNKLVLEIQKTPAKDVDDEIPAPLPLQNAQAKIEIPVEEKQTISEIIPLPITPSPQEPKKVLLPEPEPVAPAQNEPLAEVVPLPAIREEREEKDLNLALKNTRMGFIQKLTSLFSRPEIREEDFEEIEAILFSADIGVKTAQKLLDILRERVRSEKKTDKAFLQKVLKEEICKILESVTPAAPVEGSAPKVMMFVGVNGAGKTTSIGKLGALLKNSGKRVLFGAGDTFRAAATLQLTIWGERIGAEVISGEENSDSASVLFQAIQKGKNDHVDYVLCDTAGRLHTKTSLMDELKKVYRVVGKAQAGAPHEVLLVIDATMGQNALTQAREFALATPLTGVVLSKLDGTAKGGIAIGIVDELKVPIRYIGIGEKVNDLRDFDAKLFVNALFEEA
jgi:signal recognition particle-docking protein FtsY